MPPRTNSKDERSPRSKKATRPEVIAWASRIPETQDAQDMVETFRRSNLAAKISPEQEAASSRSVEATKQLYDDGQILCRALPHAKPLVIPTVAPGKIGDFLNVGRFIEIMQYVYVRDKPGGDRKKRCFDLNFLIQAITMPDGNIGLYLSVLHWFVRAFNELSQKESDKLKVAEFGIALSSQMDEENDEILACEILRQYLIKVKPNQRTAFSEKMENLLDRLKFIDISECSTEDRVRFLINAHQTLIEDTHFFNVFSEKISQARNEIRTEKQGLEASIVERNHSLKELEERLNDKELSEPEKEKISGKVETRKKEIDEINVQKSHAVKKLKEADLMFLYMTHSRCLGYDRHHNRYWHMPELSANILVESGWAVPLPRRERKELPSSAPIVSNFVYASDLSQLHYLRADGKHRKCDATMMSAPEKEVQWKIYAPDELIQLSASLNSLGIREKALRAQINKIKSTIKNTARPQPVFVEDAMEALKSCLGTLASELEKAEFLTQELPEDWEAKLETATCSKLKSMMSTLFSLISKVMIKKEFFLADQTWKEIIGETNSISRLYYLCKMVDRSVLWGTGLENEGCKSCGKPQWLKSLRRCLGCGDVFHEGYCMAFYTNVCSVCAGCAGREKRTATNNVCYKEMDEEGTSKSERGDENWLPMETDETGSVSGKRKLGSESDGERERVPNSRYQLRGVAGMEGALLDGLA